MTRGAEDEPGESDVDQADPLVCRHCGGRLKITGHLCGSFTISRVLQQPGLAPPKAGETSGRPRAGGRRAWCRRSVRSSGSHPPPRCEKRRPSSGGHPRTPSGRVGGGRNPLAHRSRPRRPPIERPMDRPASPSPWGRFAWPPRPLSSAGVSDRPSSESPARSPAMAARSRHRAARPNGQENGPLANSCHTRFLCLVNGGRRCARGGFHSSSWS